MFTKLQKFSKHVRVITLIGSFQIYGLSQYDVGTSWDILGQAEVGKVIFCVRAPGFLEWLDTITPPLPFFDNWLHYPF